MEAFYKWGGRRLYLLIIGNDLGATNGEENWMKLMGLCVVTSWEKGCAVSKVEFHLPMLQNGEMVRGNQPYHTKQRKLGSEQNPVDGLDGVDLKNTVN